jgi:protein SCO1/2
MIRTAVLFAILLAVPSANAQNPALAPLADAGIDQKLSAQIPLDVQLRDEAGRPVVLGKYFHDKPVIFMLVYYECPMLCGLVLNGVFESVRTLKLTAGDDYHVIAVSFDSSETPELAAAKKDQLLSRFRMEDTEAGWHFLTGDENAIRTLAEAVGFRYTWDKQTLQWVHGSAIMVVTPDGKLSRYFFGVEYPPRDIRLALVEASQGKIGSLIDKALLYCFHYNPLTGRYGFAIMTAIRIAGIATIAVLGTFVAVALRRERAQRKAQADAISTIPGRIR